MRINENELLFAKVREGAIIPTKRDEDAGYDVYSCFEEDYMIIEPHSTVMIPTGIASAMGISKMVMLKERGSTGTKGMAIRCGIIDSGFRAEWIVVITNTNNYPIIISKLQEDETILAVYPKVKPSKVVVYPYTKGICQAIVLPVPKMEVKEVTFEELKSVESERGMGLLGSSGK